MGFRTNCDIKGCRKEMEPVIDKTTQQVFCTECGGEIHSVSEFMKRQMVSLHQTKRNDNRRLAYSVKCSECQKEAPPVLDEKGEVVVCSYCKKPLKNLTRPFIELMKQTLKKRAQEL